ncbi:MAG: biotin synthase BioB [Nitrospirae bacterium CG_4_10_14_0_8_um_filter_41_23]|nr:MAG: biotin synthase BioB [Nitrospirae bacterium CG2_30_41_42]PIQ93505.1 MAG: biotin synthase BioB [Nitrospirae bacterium CG11_big_fil_rev_8_21_14_0_20_41_14]PIV43445.1 MAG: biotin synthase BioB [Nitrospirae bacterium CG02_land_8_20_14_3_00_41_53]PIW87921.1 MAG: biotin synthase BioB [Nitrospirae bacterium CG_4_8_14_3_um_filter_41_47]PIY87071.1 MAG: biotin synthase BioB [Nitrospirae bacterium CG_4_10_14_0_8_um_filter_41_23]PJA79077.1 MAG: biotin synthase BioB [Nitrospirae bacterium CG_4_9_14
MIKYIEKKILNGNYLSREEALYIAHVSGTEIFELFVSANIIRNHFMGNKVDLCSIVNAKSGACPEDCSFCVQSSKSKAEIKVYPLINKKIVINHAKKAKNSGAKRFSIVTSGRKVSDRDLSAIADMISEIKESGLLPCASLGLLREKELAVLKSAGLGRYHHNLETSESFFPQICRTHNFTDKLKTIDAVKSIGLSICSGGIFGMGETWQDRIDMAFMLKELNVDSIPINFLIPIKGTALGYREFLHPFEALKTISLYRFILPRKEIRICGGRMQILGEFNSMVFFAGADSLLTGNYLTTVGRSYEDDLRIINAYGLTT